MASLIIINVYSQSHDLDNTDERKPDKIYQSGDEIKIKAVFARNIKILALNGPYNRGMCEWEILPLYIQILI